MPNKFDLFIEKLLLIPRDLKAIENKYAQYLDITMFYRNDYEAIELVSLRAKKDAPKGTGTNFMNELVNWADENKKTIILQTAQKGDFDTSKEFKSTSSGNRLKKFYGRFGFKLKPNSLSYLDGNMVRLPK